MKKKIFISLILLIAIFILPSVVKAATSEVTLEKIEVVSPASGTYTTGQVITINAVYSENVVASVEGLTPSLKLKFGSSQNYGIIYITTGTIKGNIIEYTYTITDYDSGLLKLDTYYDSGLKDEEGNIIQSTTDSITLTGSEISANPIKWTDTSNLEISLNEEYYLDIKGLTELSGHDYYVFITNSSEEPTITLNEYSEVSNATSTFSKVENLEKYIEKNGDIYYWICEEQRNYDTGLMEQKFIVSAKKIERLPLKSLGTRMKAYFFSDRTSIYLYEANYYDVERKINLKIGKITDKSVLLAIKNGEKNALANLLNYAKSDTGLYTGTVPLGKSATITDKFELIDEECYYVYKVLDDENGTYYPVEDISLYQACVSETIGKNLWDYLDDNFKWNISEENYFSNFINAKAVLEELSVNEETTKISIGVKDIVAKIGKQHQFYYYISNSIEDVPNYDSNLWAKVEKFEIDESNGNCYISTGDIMNLSYIDKLNTAVEIYISLYEVVGDEEITSETILGEYELGLNAKRVELISEEDNSKEEEKQDDTTTAPDTQLPQTGVNTIVIVSILMLLVVLAIVTLTKYRNMRDIK